MRVRFLGTGDAFHGAGRAHASLLVESADARLLVDCGATTPHALARAGIDGSSVDAVLVTHLHGDHFAGVPFLFLDAMLRTRRTRPLVVAGPVLTASRIELLFRTLYASTSARVRPFFLDYREIAPGEAIDAAGWHVAAFRARHMSPPHVALALRLERDGRVLGVSGDSAETAELARVAEGADLFVCECTDASARGEGEPSHLSARDIARLRPGWRARRIVLTHLSADSRAEAASLEGVEVGDDGLVVEL